MDRGSENKERRKYFFKPRIGSRYAEKWNGYRTMVLGAHQICTAKCEFLDLCCSNEGVWEMDNACPVYEDGRDDPYLRLSNGNRIEMDAYIEDAANYPAYSAFTKYILEEKGFVSPEKREYFWERVVFCNFLQHYLPNGNTPTYEEESELYDADIDAFKEMLHDVQPEVIYVWSDSVANALRKNIKRIDGLKEMVMSNEAQVMEVSFFSYNTTVECSREWVRQLLEKVLGHVPSNKKLAPLDEVIYRALSQNYIIVYEQNKFANNYNCKFFDYSTFLGTIYKEYLKRWNVVEACFVKLDKNGERQKQHLRQLLPSDTDDPAYRAAVQLFEL